MKDDYGSLIVAMLGLVFCMMLSHCCASLNHEALKNRVEALEKSK